MFTIYYKLDVNWFQKDEKKHDTEFALSTGNVAADVNVIGTAAEVMAEAVVRAVKAAESTASVPGLADR